MVGASDDYPNRFINELPQTFDPYKYDPNPIAKLAKLAGMKYIVFTTKHHSGFCMWDTKTTEFKITNIPYGKNLMKVFVEGTWKAGLAIGFYYSPEDFKFLRDNSVTINRGEVKLDGKTESAYNDLIRRQTRGALNTPEQTIPGAGTDALWESCITMGTQWQYKPTTTSKREAG